MSSDDPQFWEKALRARDQLAAQFLGHPDVSLIDIGLDPEDHTSAQRNALCVHVRRLETAKSLGLPGEIDGIPVRVLEGDYHPD
jgi:hypothetical protein